ncbi:hypothetical protein HPB52_021120 [Rhipicephalus sanguineus]|uniref:Uncharacterized protein n=1 Tax=Rhipicephalus sanguineus TaxID=34632 RepID=A0A9D4QB67_RHISA|nr:hypothetical protein HPB52_021120 [Rhipicephalus sanguineus]
MASTNKSNVASEQSSHFASTAMSLSNADSSGAVPAVTAATTPTAPSLVRASTAPPPAPAAAAKDDGGDASDGDDGADKAKQETADQAVLPTLLRIIRKKLSKRFKETRELVMFIVVVLFAVIYLIISSKIILDNIELPAQYLDQHLKKDTLCTDPYGSICNQNYFHSGENRHLSLWPYRYANLQFIYEVFRTMIIRDFKNFKAPVNPANETAIYKTLYFLKNCTNSTLKRALAKYTLRVLLWAQIRKLPHLGVTKERRRDNTATEKCEYAYCLLKTPQLMPPHERLYNYITAEFYSFIDELTMERMKWTEEELKKSPTLAELQDATAVKNQDGSVMYQGFNWTLFFNTLLSNTKFTFTDSTTVFVEDYAIVTNVMKLVQKTAKNLVLNYIILEVWSFIAPLLPAKYLHNVRYLPDTDFVSLGNSSIPTNCFKLAELFCPEGMAAAIQ